MRNKNKIFEQLKKQYSELEIADAHIISEPVSAEEKISINKEVRQIRLKQIENQTEGQKLHADLVRLRILIRAYIDKEPFAEEKSFGAFLDEYIRIIKKSKKSFSEDIGLHYTKLSRIINDREDPNIELMYRLEAHSADLLPAILWWELLAKKQAFNVRQDVKSKKIEAKKVKNVLVFNEL